MDAILLLAQDPKQAHMSVGAMCMDIKEMPEANHKLYFARIMFGAFHISKGEVEEEDLSGGVTKKTSVLTGEHELIIFPAKYEEQLEKLKTDKNIVMVKNCMCVAGESEKKAEFRKAIIEWLLDDEKKWDYSNVDLSES